MGKDCGDIREHMTKMTTKSQPSPYPSDDEDSDDELGALIYQSSETAKAFAAAKASNKRKSSDNMECNVKPKLRKSKRCSHDGCDKYLQQEGLCTRHYKESLV